MNYEEKMRILNACKPEYKDILLLRMLKGETVDITKDADLFYTVNKDRMDMTSFTNRDKFQAAAEEVKQQKATMADAQGKSKEGKLRWLGDIPAEIFFSRKEFSPMLTPEERGRNAKKWLNEFNVFRASDKQL